MDFSDLKQIGRLVLRELGLSRTALLAFLVVFGAFGDLAAVALVAELAAMMFGGKNGAPAGLLGQRGFSPADVVFLFTAMLLVTTLLRLWVQLIVARFAFEISANVASRLFSEMFALNPVFLRSKWKVPDLMSLLSAKIDTLSYCVVLPFLSTLAAVTVSLFLLMALFLLSGPFFLLAIAFCSAVFLLVRSTLAAKASSMGGRIYVLQNETLALLQAAFVAILDIKANQREAPLLHAFKQRVAQLGATQAGANAFAGWSRLVVEFLGLSSLAVLSFLALQKSGNSLGLLSMLAGSAYILQRLLPNLQLINTNYIALTTGRSALHEIMAYQREIAAVQRANAETERILTFQSLRLEQVELSYPDKDERILADVDLDLNAMDKLAISGPSGSGKSSLLLALLGFLTPQHGRITVNGRHALRDVAGSWLGQVAFVGQEVTIYDGTIGSNLSTGISAPVHNADFERVRGILRLGKLLDEKGLKTPTKFGGAQLSGGQRQRIALARALLSAAPVLILDEPTSSLDPETTNDVIDYLLSLNRCIILVTHDDRISTRFPRRVVIDEGAVREIEDAGWVP